MYKPEIGKVYESPAFDYIIIKGFSLKGPNCPNIIFEVPDSTEQISYTGVHQVSDFLHSLTPVNNINKELKYLKSRQQRLEVEQRRINQNKSFLERFRFSQESQLAEKTQSSEGSVYIDIDNPD